MILAAATSPTALTYVLAVLSSVSIFGGLIFILAGALGVLRLPDFYTRLHAAGVTDTLGAELILLGLILQSGFTQTSLKLLIIGFLLTLTSPTATHAIASAAWSAKVEPLLGTWKSKGDVEPEETPVYPEAPEDTDTLGDGVVT